MFKTLVYKFIDFIQTLWNDNSFDWLEDLLNKFLAITIVILTLCSLFTVALLCFVILINVKALLIILGATLCISLIMKMILSINVHKDEDCKEEISPNDIVKTL